MNLSIGIAFLISILPFVFIPQAFNPYEFPKFILFVVGVELLALYFVWNQLRKKRITLPKIDIGVFLVLGFGIVNLISDILGIDPKISLLGSSIRHQGFLTVLSGIILFILTRSSFDSKSFIFFKKITLITAFLLSLITILQIIEINLFQNFAIPTYNGRIVGTMGNPNFLGGYLLMLLPFIVFNTDRIIKNFMKVVIILVNLGAIFFTDSRAAYLGVFVLFLIYILQFILKLRFRKIIIGLSIVLIFLSLFKLIDLFIYKDTAFKDTSLIVKERGCPESWPDIYPWKIITDIHNSIPTLKREAPCDNRFLVWVVGLQALNKRPILGYGQENFEFAIPTGKMHGVDNAHNIFLEVAISSGLVGLFLYVAIIFYFLKKSSRLDIKLAIIAFLIVAQFNPLSIAQISLFWFLLGVSSKVR